MKFGRTTAWLDRSITVVVVALATIGVVIVVRRVLNLMGLTETYVHPTFGAFDGAFALHPVLTLSHIIPGGLFMVLAPLQFVPRIRSRYPLFHRVSGRLLIVVGVVLGTTALAMSVQMAIGGANETAATAAFALFFLFALGKAVYHIRRRQVAPHREWMIRMFAIGLAVATVRPIVGMFFAFTNLSPREFFGIAFWLGFTVHLIAAEVWINFTRPKQQADPMEQRT